MIGAERRLLFHHHEHDLHLLFLFFFVAAAFPLTSSRSPKIRHIILFALNWTMPNFANSINWMRCGIVLMREWLANATQFDSRLGRRLWTLFDVRPIPSTAQLQLLQKHKRNFRYFFALESSWVESRRDNILFIFMNLLIQQKRTGVKKQHVNWVWAHSIVQFKRRHHSTASTARTKCSVPIKCDVMNLHERININIMPCCSQNKKNYIGIEWLAQCSFTLSAELQTTDSHGEMRAIHGHDERRRCGERETEAHKYSHSIRNDSRYEHRRREEKKSNMDGILHCRSSCTYSLFLIEMYTKNAWLAFGCLRICECKHKGTFAAVAVVVIFSSPFFPGSSLVGRRRRRRRRLSHLKRRTFSYQSPSVRPTKKTERILCGVCCLLLSSTTEPTLHKLIYIHRSTPTKPIDGRNDWDERRVESNKKKIVSCETRSNCRHAICGQFRILHMPPPHTRTYPWNRVEATKKLHKNLRILFASVYCVPRHRRKWDKRKPFIRRLLHSNSRLLTPNIVNIF